ncbi:hypothetical protein Bca4012_026364 [Brassica carinata]|uniref:Uncharacterized protein n=1 Tax=Brassica carinata TaxID=52824 RepID=A0A8X7VII8_BRACI|nr:hypothetical protein Bca52824_023424 [Brassica carinata]
MPTSSSSFGDHLFVRPYSSDASSDASLDTSADSPSHALNPTPPDAVSQRSSATSVCRVENVISSGPDSCPAAPPVEYTAIFHACCGIGFRQNLSWIMVELYGLFRISQSQLTLRSWGLIHALQVLSDLSAIEITGSMVATAFCTREIGEGSRRFELSPRPFCRSPVEFPEWLDNTPTSGEYFFAIHLGPRPNGLRLSWSPSGVSPENPPEWIAFPEDLFNLASNLRDLAFLLHPDINQLTSLASTDEHLFIPEHLMDALIAARLHFDSLSLDSSRSVERPPSQLCPDASSSHSPTDSAENPPSSKRPRR